MAKIVLCEDEVLIQKLMRVMLRSTDHELFIADNGLKGLELAEQVKPDVIFTDVSMPVCNGLQFANLLKNHTQLASIPLVFITARALHTDVVEGYKHGAANYLIKPFSAADLYERIERFTLPPLRGTYVR